MKVIATLCLVQEGGAQKVIAISPDSNMWFVNREDLTGDMAKLAEQTEGSGNVGVLGMLFGPGEDT